MRIEKIKVKNFGPISEVEITPRTLENEHQIPIAIVGQNGAGKSLTLSSILDAVTEARRQSFSELQEVPGNQYIKLSTRKYIKNPEDYSYLNIKLKTPSGNIEFNELVTKLNGAEFMSRNLAPNLQNELIQSDFKNSGFYKNITINEDQKELIKNSLFLYFPYFRYETAYWMNEKANVNFANEKHYFGQSKFNPIRTNIIEETKRWILNVLLDREIYELKLGEPVFIGGHKTFLGYEGPNTLLFNLVNEIISTMLMAKNPNIVSARVGISPKANREIAIFSTNNDGIEEIVAPEISQLSSGELMTLGLATEIIRTYELVKGYPPKTLEEVNGIVLIDEIDLHLHINFQKTVLPKILRKFPKVQFIFTTHSPFFLLGMTESGDIDIYNLPLGNKIIPEEFIEFKSTYDIFMERNERFRVELDAIKNESQRNENPLIITEGKTDWKYIKSMLDTAKNQGLFLDLNLSFHEYGNELEMGDIKLSQMCEHFSAIPQKRKMIFIFDRDNPIIIKSMSGGPSEFKNHGNNVYSLCLPIPNHREKYRNLSIELYFSDATLRSPDPDTSRRLWFSNEIEIVMSPGTGKKVYRTTTCNLYDEAEEFGKKVFDQPVEKIIDETGKPVALSKAAFAELISTQKIKPNEDDLIAFSKLFSVLAMICTH